MKEADGNHTGDAVVRSHSGGELNEALRADEVGLKTRAERIASPGDAGSLVAGPAQQRIIHDDAERFVSGKVSEQSAAHGRKQRTDGKALSGEESVGGRPVFKLFAGSGEQTGEGVTAETKQGAHGEGLRTFGAAALVEEGGAVVPELFELGEEPGRVFFKGEGGVWRRRSASRLLSSMIHSTVSPRENSMA